MHVRCGYAWDAMRPCRYVVTDMHGRSPSSASCLPAPPLDHSARTVESLKALLADAALCLACCVLIDLLRLVLDRGEIYICTRTKPYSYICNSTLSRIKQYISILDIYTAG